MAIADVTVGLTGGIASGKSTVADYWQALGIHCVDMDTVAREVVEPGTPGLNAIVGYFSDAIPNILQTDQRLNRQALRHHIFDHPQDKAWLENLLHPLIRQQSYRQLEQNTSPYNVLVSPLLIEKKLPVKYTVVVDVSVEKQIERIIQRDKTDAASAQKIINAQISREARLEHADFIINNNGDLKKTLKEAENLHRKLCALLS